MRVHAHARARTQCEVMDCIKLAQELAITVGVGECGNELSHCIMKAGIPWPTE
jgi:hypothetical protein